MDVVYTCPLGNECETAKDNKIYRCRWFVKLRGKDPQSDQEVDEFRCAMEWAPVLAIEQSLHERQTGAAVESFRNEMINQNSNSNNLLGRLINSNKLIGQDNDS